MRNLRLIFSQFNAPKLIHIFELFSAYCTAVGTNVNQHTKLNNQKRVSMSGNRADNNFFSL